ncbi:MAG: recombinase family protein [Candidatus Hodarchaeota archaeon]
MDYIFLLTERNKNFAISTENMPKIRVSIYARESCKDTNLAPPIDNQINSGKKWIDEIGGILVDVYADNGFSGGDWKRPDWNKSVRDARRNKYNVLWVWNQDRIARDTEQYLWYFRNLRERNIRIFEGSSNDYIDMDSLGGKIQRQSIAQASEIFRLITSQKVKNKYEQKKEKGEPWGRKCKDFDIEKAILLRNNGLGWRLIAKEFEGVSYQTIRRRILETDVTK